jgi:peptidoglycan-associated lipoprotein
MKKTQKLTLTTVAIITLTLNGFSQKALKKANDAFEARQYKTALDMYKNVYQAVPKDKKPLVLYRTGVASERIQDMKGAQTYYEKAIALNFDDPNVYQRLAEVLKAQQKYPEAIVEFNNYKAKGGDAKKADLGVKSCELAQQWKDNPLRFKVENMSMINSKERDYSPAYSDKKYQTLIFTSSREGAQGPANDPIAGTNRSDLYETKIDKNGKWSTPVLLPPAISTPVNEGQGWVSKKGDMIFFTRCPEDKNKVNFCGIYMAKKQGSTWGPAERLPFSTDTVKFVHPTLSADMKTLYFASNMSGGYGGMDIWSCSYDVKANQWGQPKNLGPAVNTEGNEVYPTISDDGKKLYFSSDYHPGMGGLDIFMAEAGADGRFTKPVENMKAPINSSYDDFDIIWEGKKNRGYFTSNREGGKGSDDIWSFNLPPLNFNLRGSVTSTGDKFNKGVGEPVEAVKVKVVGSDGSVNEFTTGKDGTYKMDKLKEKTSYTVSIAPDKNSKSTSHGKLGFLSSGADPRVIATFADKSKDFVADFQARPVEMELKFPEVQYDLGKATLRQESKDSLNFLYNILKDNPTIRIELDAHTDSRGKAAANQTLSLARAQACVDYLSKEKGIPAERMTAKGFGSSQPIFTDAQIKAAKSKQEQEAMHQKNRRTTFKVLSFDYVDPNAPKNPTNNTNTQKPKDPDDDDGGE